LSSISRSRSASLPVDMSICALRRSNGGTIQSPGQKRNASSCSSALALVVTVRSMLEASNLVRRQRWSYHSAPISYSTTLIGESSLQQGRASHRSCPCFAALGASGELNTAELLFGCSHTSGGYFKPLPYTTVCVNRDPAAESSFTGR
jgi:hypothetical protein